MGLLGLGGDPLPREKRDLVDGLTTEFEGLRNANQERLERYRTYRQENESARDLSDAGPTETFDYGNVAKQDKYTRHKVQLPFGMALTVKHAYRIAGRLPDAIVDRREETAEERYRSDTMEKMWWGILRHSGEETVFGTGAWHSSMLGSACFDVYMDFEAQIPRIRALDPAGVLVVRGVDNPHDFQRVYRYWQVSLDEAKATYRGEQFGGVAIDVESMESSHKVGTTEMVTIVEMADRQRTVRFVVGKNDPSVPLLEREHKLGFVPYVVIPNIGPYDDIWGWADYEFVRSLVAYIPALFSREADILRTVANGTMLEKGTGQDPNVVRGVMREGGVLPSRREGSVDPIQAPEVPQFEAEHARRAMEMMKMLGFAPDGAWGTNGVLTTGTAKALDLQPMLEFTAMKQTNWSAGLARLARYCFLIAEKQQVGNATYRGARPGTTTRQTTAFMPFQIGPKLDPITQSVDPASQLDALAGDVEMDGGEESIILPRTPQELFQGDYQMRFVWQNRIDPDDPSYVLSELNKFAQGAQSLRTTLERLGFQAPEDEMKLIEQEAERFPWLRQGLVALTMAAIRGNAQGSGGGNPGASQGELAMDASGMTTQDGGGAGGAYNADAGAAGLSGGLGQLFGGA